MLDRISFSDVAASLPAQRHVASASKTLSTSMERLSSGLRINRAADDAAGNAVAETLSTQVRGLAQANANAQDAINMLQTADGGLTEAANVLQRMRELVVQAANDTYTQDDRAHIQVEIDQLKYQLTAVSQQTQFNGRRLLDGSIAQSRFAEPNGAYLISNPTVGFPGNQGPMIRDFAITHGGADEDMEFSMSLVNTGFVFPSATLPALAAAITTSSGWVWGEMGYNEFFVGSGPPSDYSPHIMPSTGWGVSIFWGQNMANPTLDAGKTFQLYLDHTLSPVTIDRSLRFQVGSNSGQTMAVGLRGVSAESLNLEGVTVRGATEAESHQKADKALRSIDRALGRVNEERSRLGAWQNRLEQSVNITEHSGIEQATSLSGIQDADFAKESAGQTRSQLLQQASIGLLAQANTIPQMALKLLDSGGPAQAF